MNVICTTSKVSELSHKVSELIIGATESHLEVSELLPSVSELLVSDLPLCSDLQSSGSKVELQPREPYQD